MEQIGRYLVRGEIGKGGFGTVYRAWDPVVRRDVAIKVLTTLNDPGMVARFRSEPASTGILKHRNIITIYDFGEHDSVPYLVMELLEGRTLREVIETGAQLSLFEKVAILEEMARGLLHAHQNGVIHRDVKPANIMLLADGSVKVLDFGIARMANPDVTRHTSSGAIVGTAAYMAPEQFAGEDATALSDIFSYGVVCYELLSGKQPFHASNPMAIINLVSTKVPEPLRTLVPDCPEALDAIVQTATAKRSTERYQSLQDLLFDLAPIAAGLRKAWADGLAAEAQRSLETGDLDSAQQNAWRALELDPNHAASQELRRRIQRQRERLALEQRFQAAVQGTESLLRSESFDEAIGAMEDMRSWLNSDSASDLRAELEGRLSVARERLERAQRITALLAEAREAADRHDLVAASRSAALVLSIDSGNTVALGLEAWAANETERSRVEAEKAENERLRRQVDAASEAARQQAAEALRAEEELQARQAQASKSAPQIESLAAPEEPGTPQSESGGHIRPAVRETGPGESGPKVPEGTSRQRFEKWREAWELTVPVGSFADQPNRTTLDREETVPEPPVPPRLSWSARFPAVRFPRSPLGKLAFVAGGFVLVSALAGIVWLAGVTAEEITAARQHSPSESRSAAPSIAPPVSAPQANKPPFKAPSAEAPPGSYWQVLVTSKRSSAETTLRSLLDKGFPASVSAAPNNLTLVLVGPYRDTVSLARAKTELEAAGFRMVVRR